jgi:hypothetical protein
LALQTLGQQRERSGHLGLVMMPSMTAGLNAVPLHLMSRASFMKTRAVAGRRGPAIMAD